MYVFIYVYVCAFLWSVLGVVPQKPPTLFSETGSLPRVWYLLIRLDCLANPKDHLSVSPQCWHYTYWASCLLWQAQVLMIAWLGYFPSLFCHFSKKKKIADKVKEFLLSLAVMEYIMLGNLVSASSCGEQV